MPTFKQKNPETLLDHSITEEQCSASYKEIISPEATFIAKHNQNTGVNLETYYPSASNLEDILDTQQLFPQLPTHFKSEFMISKLKDDGYLFSLFKVKASIHNPKKLKIRSVGVKTKSLVYSQNLAKFLSHKLDQINVTEALSLIGDIHDDIVEHSYLNELHELKEIAWTQEMSPSVLALILRTLMANKIVAIVVNHDFGPACCSFAQFCDILDFNFMGFYSSLASFAPSKGGLIIIPDYLENDYVDLYITKNDNVWETQFHNKITQHLVHISVFSRLKSRIAAVQRENTAKTLDCLLAYKSSVYSRIDVASSSSRPIKLWYDKKFYRSIASSIGKNVIVKRYLF